MKKKPDTVELAMDYARKNLPDGADAVWIFGNKGPDRLTIYGDDGTTALADVYMLPMAPSAIRRAVRVAWKKATT